MRTAKPSLSRPPAGFELGGGIGNAIQGTVVTVAIASLISIPIAGGLGLMPQ